MELPKWLIADDGDDRDFVVHCHYPRFIIEFVDGEGIPTFIDDQSEYISNELANEREPAQGMARLMREAGEFFMQQMEGE